MNKAAMDYNSKGLEFVNAGNPEVAIKFFSMAIEEDPDFLEAYKNRGETLIKLDRVDEGEKDLQKAEGSKKEPKKTIKKEKKVVEKYNLDEVEDLWGSVVTEDRYDDDDDDLFGLGNDIYDDDYPDDVYEDDQASDSSDEQYEDDLLYDDTYQDDSLEREQAFETDDEQVEHETIPQEEEFIGDETEEEHIPEEAVEDAPEEVDSSAVLEYIGGLRQEVAHARLFEPLENSILLVDEETNDEQVIFFEQLSCLRIPRLPGVTSNKKRESCTQELIETVDGKTYHELVHPVQDLDNLLICLSPDDQSPFSCTLFPKSNIKSRTLDKPLTDLLLEKRFISQFMLQKALQEYKQLKSLTLEKIIAKKAHLRLADIEEALDQAKEMQMQGLQKEEILLISGLANEEAILGAAEHLEKIQKLKIGQFLIQKGVVKENEVYSSLAEKHKIQFLDLKGRKLSQKSLACLPRSMIVNNEILPLVNKDDRLLVATYFIDTKRLREAIIKETDCKDVTFVLTPPSQIKKIIRLLYPKKK